MKTTAFYVTFLKTCKAARCQNSEDKTNIIIPLTRPKVQTNVVASGKKIGPDNAQQAATI